MNELSDSIERLYAVFADAAKPDHIDGCPCCWDDKEARTLLSTPLRDISPQQISSYASSAFLTVGGLPDYLYFLPRILEISATNLSWWPDPEVTGRAIRLADPFSWPDNRINALRSYLHAVIESIFEKSENQEIDSWLCAIALMGLDVHPYLQSISRNHEALLAYFEDNAETLSQSKLRNAFWELPNEGHDVIVEWFFSPEIRRIPYEAYGCLIERIR